MNLYQPLAAFPQFLVLEFPGYKEYRIENWHIARDGSGTVVHSTSKLTWTDACQVFALPYIWPKVVKNSFIMATLLIFYIVWILYSKCTQVLYESVIVLPTLGIQLETHRGFPPVRFIVSRRFIPMSSLQDIFVHEALSGWNVRFYLAVLSSFENRKHALYPCFSSLKPYFPVLHYVYNSIHDTLDP